MPIINNNDSLAGSNTNFILFIENAINDRMRKESNIIFDKKKEEMIKELGEKKDEIISGVLLNLQKQISCDQRRDELIITIRKS